MMKYVFVIIGVLILFSCGNKQTPDGDQKQDGLIVTPVNYPLYYFAQRIGGEFIQLEYPIPVDVDPAYWVPDEKALEVYQSADLILANGADYAKWMNNVSLPSSRIVYTSKEREDLYIQLKNVSTHSHGPEGEHEHTGYAFTTWLNFELAAVQAEAIKNVLVQKMPANKLALEKNFKALQDDLLGLHKKMIEITNEMEDQQLIGSHPVYQYLTAAYGIKIHSVHFEPNEMPNSKQWKEIPHLLDHYPANIMLWEGEPLADIKEVLKKYKLDVLVFNPCGNKPSEGDFLSEMTKNVEGLNLMLK